MILSPSLRQRVRLILDRGWRRLRRWVKWSLIALATLALLYVSWPCLVLWELNQALIQNDRPAMARLVDLDAIRGQLTLRLNKDRKSAIHELSDDFVQWVDVGVRGIGEAWLSEEVTLDWVRALWLDRSAPGFGFLGVLDAIGFDSARNLRVRIAREDRQLPLKARLHLGPNGWRLAVLYY